MQRYLIAGVALLALGACMEDGGGTATATVVQFGDNSSRWSFDGECDDPRFIGPGSASTLLAEDAFRDATDCKALFERGLVAYRG